MPGSTRVSARRTPPSSGCGAPSADEVWSDEELAAGREVVVAMLAPRHPGARRRRRAGRSRRRTRDGRLRGAATPDRRRPRSAPGLRHRRRGVPLPPRWPRKLPLDAVEAAAAELCAELAGGPATAEPTGPTGPMGPTETAEPTETAGPAETAELPHGASGTSGPIATDGPSRADRSRSRPPHATRPSIRVGRPSATSAPSRIRDAPVLAEEYPCAPAYEDAEPGRFHASVSPEPAVRESPRRAPPPRTSAADPDGNSVFLGAPPPPR